jgi:hypothetical protein
MKVKQKVCNECGELKVIWKNHEGSRYCKYCWTKQTMTGKAKGVAKKPFVTNKSSKPIAHRSPKRAKQERLYLSERKTFLLSSPQCQANLPNICTKVSTEVHHKKGRTGYLLTYTPFWLSVCRSCHEWIENHPNEAKELGFSMNRLT